MTVVKHGNRGITSKSGGADVLEALGVPIDLPPEKFRNLLRRHRLGFMFAPAYHPAFKAIVPVRKALAAEGIPPIFNLLGPLLNPARPEYQLVGVFSREAAPKIAQALLLLGRKRAWVVHGTDAEGNGIDEISTMGPTHVFKVGFGKIEEFVIDHGDHHLPEATTAQLQGGTREERR